MLKRRYFILVSAPLRKRPHCRRKLKTRLNNFYDLAYVLSVSSFEVVLSTKLHTWAELLYRSPFFAGKQHWLIQRKRNTTQYAILKTKKVSGNVKRHNSSSFAAQKTTNRSLNRGLCDLKKDGFFFTSAVLCTDSAVGRKLVHCRKSCEFHGVRMSMNPALTTPFATGFVPGRGSEGTDSFTWIHINYFSTHLLAFYHECHSLIGYASLLTISLPL